jgi:hypothetical protein
MVAWLLQSVSPSVPSSLAPLAYYVTSSATPSLPFFLSLSLAVSSAAAHSYMSQRDVALDFPLPQPDIHVTPCDVP